MTFTEAKNRLAAIAGGKYCSVDYGESLNNPSGRSIIRHCNLYIENTGSVCGETWEEAFLKLEYLINPPNLSKQGPE